MFLYRLKVEELDGARLLSLKNDLVRSEASLRARCPIREMSVVSGADNPAGELDIYLALDDFIEGSEFKRIAGELNALLDTKPQRPRVSAELIHI